ncbi:MAG: dihydrodipicolinate synthase family protein, partial [Clostridia bacterium]|nr:dihydrodipicolinate synthase family protein [Clostridia bacterium]
VTHFTEIARNVTLPIILYNVPARTGMNILPNTVLKLSKVSNIVAVKEASGNLQQTYDILADCPKYFTVYIGNDEQILPALMLGASGIISVASNVVPALICSICNLYDEGKIKEAQQIFKKVLPFINSLFCETNPIPVKTAMNLIGFDAGNLRLPLVPMQENNLNKLKTELKKLNLISQ